MEITASVAQAVEHRLVDSGRPFTGLAQALEVGGLRFESGRSFFLAREISMEFPDFTTGMWPKTQKRQDPVI